MIRINLPSVWITRVLLSYNNFPCHSEVKNKMKDVSFWVTRNKKNRGWTYYASSMATQLITGYTSSTTTKNRIKQRSNDYNKYLCVSRIRTIFLYSYLEMWKSMHFVVFYRI